MFEHFNPKPAKYQGINALHDWLRRVQDLTYGRKVLQNFQYILQGVAAQQLSLENGIPPETHRRNTGELDKYPWVTVHYGVEFTSDYDKGKRYNYEQALKEAREMGLFTYHSESGKAIGLPAYSLGYIRVNPEAYRDMLKLFSRLMGGDTWDVSRSLSASTTDPGWYEIPSNVTDRYNRAALLHCHRYLLSKELESRVSNRGGSPRLLVRMAGEEINSDAAVMEACLARYAMTNLKSYRGEDEEHYRKLFPTVDIRVLTEELYSLTASKSLDDDEEKKLSQLHDLIQDIRTIRTKKNLIKSYGGREGLLAAMGKDISQSIPCNCTTWLTLSRYEDGSAGGLLHDIADDFIAGRLLLNLPGTDPLK